MASSAPDNRNMMVDFFRVLSALFIVAGHGNLFNPGTNSLSPVADWVLTLRFGVPFFFIVGAYYAARGNLHYADPKRRKTLKYILSLVVFGNLLYLPYYVHLPIRLDVLIWRLPFMGMPPFHFWFLHSMLTGHLLLSIPKSRTGALWVASAIGIGSCWYLLLNEHTVLGEYMASLCIGWGFIAMGVFLREMPFKRWLSVPLIALAVAMLWFYDHREGLAMVADRLDVTLRYFSGAGFLGIALGALAFSFPAGKAPVPQIPLLGALVRGFYSFVRTAAACGLGVYILHPYVLLGVWSVAKWLKISENMVFRWTSILVVWLLCLGIVLGWGVLRGKFKKKSGDKP